MVPLTTFAELADESTSEDAAPDAPHEPVNGGADIGAVEPMAVPADHVDARAELNDILPQLIRYATVKMSKKTGTVVVME